MSHLLLVLSNWKALLHLPENCTPMRILFPLTRYNLYLFPISWSHIKRTSMVMPAGHILHSNVKDSAFHPLSADWNVWYLSLLTNAYVYTPYLLAGHRQAIAAWIPITFQPGCAAFTPISQISIPIWCVLFPPTKACLPCWPRTHIPCFWYVSGSHLPCLTLQLLCPEVPILDAKPWETNYPVHKKQAR